MALTEKERRATVLGSVLGTISLLVAFGVISALTLSFTSGVTGDGYTLDPEYEIVWAMDEAADLSNSPNIQQFGCNPALNDLFTGAFDVNSTYGTGQAYNSTVPVAIRDCPGSQQENQRLIIQPNIRASDAFDMGAKAIGIGVNFTGILDNNYSWGVFVGMVPPGATPSWIPTICTGCPVGEILDGNELYLPMTVDFANFAAIFPTWKIGIFLAGDVPFDAIPDFGEVVELDVTLYGEEVTPTVSEDQITTSFSNFFTPEVQLGAMFWFVAIGSMLAAALIWPSMTWDKMKKQYNRRRSRR